MRKEYLKPNIRVVKDDFNVMVPAISGTSTNEMDPDPDNPPSPPVIGGDGEEEMDAKGGFIWDF